MEERDIQVRGYTLRLPLDVLLVASANPEDYTNRGRIITPLKDRFGAEIRTHYPLELTDEIAVMRQEADLAAPVPDHLLEIIARFTRLLRESTAVDQGSGVSARFAVAATETIAAAALRRAVITGEPLPMARPIDLEAALPVLRGKLEFVTGQEGREDEVLEHLLRRATADTARRHLRGVDLAPLVDAVTRSPLRTGDRVTAAQVVAALPRVEVLTAIAQRLGAAGTEDPGPMASAAELALELLFLTRKLTKEPSDDGDTVSYG
jgi:magnesium chelatase subunit I